MRIARAAVSLIALAIASTLPGPARGAEPAFGDRVVVRGHLDNSRAKFLADQSGTVAFIGGSITEMDGHRPMVAADLRKRFPQTAFTFVDAGVSSTCSTTGAFRLAHDVLAKGPIDLLFVEFAVNDDQDAHHTREECVRGMEGIVRHARAANPRCDVVVTYFVNEGMLTDLQSGRTPLPMEAHESVCGRYGVPTIHLAAEVARRITDKSLTWKTYGGVHPAPAGNRIAADMIDELFDRAWAQPPAAGAAPSPHALPDPLDPMCYADGRFVDPKGVAPGNGWTRGVPNWKSIPGSKRERFTTAEMFYATEAGAEATLTFTGTSAGAYVLAGPDAGVLEASVDGGPFHAVDLYHAFSKGLHYPRTVMLATDLKPGRHTLNVRVAADSTGGGHAARVLEFVAN